MKMCEHQADIQRLLDFRHRNGADYWAGPDCKIYVGNPFSTISALCLLHELDASQSHEAVQGALSLVLGACRDDGKIKLGPNSPLHPCYTAEAARALCRFGHESSTQVERTIGYCLDSAESAGGWRCNFSKFGKGPETACANPGATLYILDTLRFFPKYRSSSAIADDAVSFLLDHWDIRTPLGPCHWGMGSKFFKIEYPFLRYNLFYYVYVLSHFSRAVIDERFHAALEHLRSRTDKQGRIVVEARHRSLSQFEFCKINLPSGVATKRFNEILQNAKAFG